MAPTGSILTVVVNGTNTGPGPVSGLSSASGLSTLLNVSPCERARHPARTWSPRARPSLRGDLAGASVTPAGTWAYPSPQSVPTTLASASQIGAPHRHTSWRGEALEARQCRTRIWVFARPSSGRCALVYWADRGGVAGVDLETAGSQLRIGSLRTLIATPILGLFDSRPHYDVTHDGQAFLLRQSAGGKPPAITVMVNWTEKLKK